ncbi:MAG TPA: NAD-dependent epimerase/dehydratase family protein [Planctomycetota bacterium]|nr:NAD-dependent epimerase/dehydratase family protein [Planctomycetota bacterium]
MMGATVLVTGAAGFIGSQLSERLLARGDAVVGLDNFNDFYDPAIKRRNVAGLLAGGGFRMVEGDIRDRDLVARAFREHRPASVVHLAAMAGVRPSLADPVLYHDVNCTGTAVMLAAARDAGVSRFVFGSSSSVYGGNTRVPFHEDDDVSRPVSPYAATKRANELTCATFHHLYGMDIAALRFFTVYGPRQRPEMAIHKFVRHVEQGVPLPLFGDGASQRDYTYIDDILDGVLKAHDRSRGFRIYNLGESQTISLRDLVAAIGRATGREPRVDWQPMQPGDVVATFADIRRAREELGYDPRTDVPAGLAKFVAWYRGPAGPAGRGTA